MSWDYYPQELQRLGPLEACLIAEGRAFRLRDYLKRVRLEPSGSCSCSCTSMNWVVAGGGQSVRYPHLVPLCRSGAAGFLLPLSGGADSSATCAIVGCMCQMVVKAIEEGDELVLEEARRWVM